MRYIIQVLITATLMFSAAADPICGPGPVWNYCTGAGAFCANNGQVNWGSLSLPGQAPLWPDCAPTTRIPQSPIDLPANAIYDATLALTTNYSDSMKMTITNTARSIKIVAKDELQSITLSETGFPTATLQLEEFHFHVPAEHTLSGMNPVPVAELHLVHKAPNETPVAIAIFLVNGANNPQLDPIISQVSTIPMCGESGEMTFDLRGLIPAAWANSFLRYNGSLTTPGCTAVRWIIFKTPIAISSNQLATLRSLFGCNARSGRSGAGVRVTCRPRGSVGCP